MLAVSLSAAAPTAVGASSPRLHKQPQAPIRPAATWRQQAAAGLAAAGLLLVPLPGAALDLSYAPSSVKEGMEARDEAADYKCKAMFDCDGDRRDYAKKQWADFVARGGVPERKAAAVAAEAPTGDAAAVAAVRDSE